MSAKVSWFFAFLFVLAVPSVHAQKVVRGTVRDASTGDVLPSANIHIEGTYRGTITNADGTYELWLEEVPATLVIRYIGYATHRRTITASSDARQDIRLEPVTYELGELVVTGEDPAVNIMRKVIERKQQWRAALETYQAEAYNRFTIANDTGIVSIIETVTETFWDKERGLEEVVQAQRQTSNLSLDEFLPAAAFVSNLYDDDIEIAGHTLIGVTHPKALSHYDVRLDSVRYRDEQAVYDIAVRPKTKRKSAFVGRVSVLDSAYALIEVELQPNEAFLFPPPIEQIGVVYQQQFSDFGGDYWLPVDFRSQMNLKVNMVGLLAFPTFHVNQVSRLTNYEVNVALPDSLFGETDDVAVDTAAVEDSTRLKEGGIAVPLTAREEEAYASIDSTLTMAKAFEPTGPLARFVDVDDGNDGGGRGQQREGGESTVLSELRDRLDFHPELWYNRVEAAHAGLGVSATLGRLELDGGGGHSFGLDGADRWSYQAGARLELGRRGRGFLEVRYAAGTVPRYRSSLYGRFVNSAYVLLGSGDYFDYFRNERFVGRTGLRIPGIRTTFSVAYHDEVHTSLSKSTDYDLLGESEPLRDNPPIDPGDLESISASVTVGEDERAFLNVAGRRWATITVEHTPSAVLDGDIEFTRYSVDATWRFNTFFQRRLIPNTLDVRLSASTHSGELPVQRFGTVDASLGVYSPFGALKTLRRQPYEGDEHLAVYWEHNFRTVPFELMGLRWFAQRAYNILLFGGHGRTWIRDDARARLRYEPHTIDRFHHELGLSVSGVLGFLRIDVAKRLDASGLAVGVAAARIF